jgi:hypothetical protein
MRCYNPIFWYFFRLTCLGMPGQLGFSDVWVRLDWMLNGLLAG